MVFESTGHISEVVIPAEAGIQKKIQVNTQTANLNPHSVR